MIPEPVGDEAVYLFLDELAADGVITLNGVVKPYSRLMIRQKLEEAAGWNALAGKEEEAVTGRSGQGMAGKVEAATRRSDREISGERETLGWNDMTAADKNEAAGGEVAEVTGAVAAGSRQQEPAERNAPLTRRQQKELEFWFSIYSPGEADGKLKLLLNPATAYYRDSLFSVTVSPILGLTAGVTYGITSIIPDGGAPDGDRSRQSSISWKNGAKVYGNYRQMGVLRSIAGQPPGSAPGPCRNTSLVSAAGILRTALSFPR